MPRGEGLPRHVLPVIEGPELPLFRDDNEPLLSPEGAQQPLEEDKHLRREHAQQPLVREPKNIADSCNRGKIVRLKLENKFKREKGAKSSSEEESRH